MLQLNVNALPSASKIESLLKVRRKARQCAQCGQHAGIKNASQALDVNFPNHDHGVSYMHHPRKARETRCELMRYEIRVHGIHHIRAEIAQSA